MRTNSFLNKFRAGNKFRNLPRQTQVTQICQNECLLSVYKHWYLFYDLNDFWILVNPPSVSKKFIYLNWCKLKTTIFKQSGFIFFKILILQLKVWYKTIQIRLKFRQSSGYRKLKFQDPRMTANYFEKCINLKQLYCFIKGHWSVNISWNWKRRNCFTQWLS